MKGTLQKYFGENTYSGRRLTRKQWIFFNQMGCLNIFHIKEEQPETQLHVPTSHFSMWHGRRVWINEAENQELLKATKN